MRRAIAIGLIGLGLSLGVSRAMAAEPVNVVYSAITTSQSVLLVAQEAGLFKKYGLDVTLTFVSSGSKAMAALLSGQTPLLISAGNPGVEATLAGADVKIIGSLLDIFPYFVVGGKGITEVAQLKGKIVGVSRFGSSGHAATLYALRKLGLEPGRDVALLQLGGGSERFQALAAGQIQATLLTPPEELVAQRQGFSILADVAKMGIPFQHSAVLTTGAMIQRRPDLLKNFMMALTEALWVFRQQKELTLKILARFFRSTDSAEVEDAYAHYVASAPRAPYPSLRGIQTVLEIIGETDPRAKSAKPEQFAEARLVREIEESGFITRLYGAAK